ncbi:chemotaxis protein methyltransferase CheR [Nannocystis exedens]|uniref:Chemotaxis protein methyltransferase CheR n=1 Tax=Nannocystis exedens TaxID=54 RepID=A0A1I1V7P2_9BACT|nr:CheR family methyltransferase [Nannocystis exedens]PCC72293.1 chemotaxis protein CheR [Nannocystis exedens]SFD77103.1 chemotaxis protein methyltransferase CheR [Nannocystis exedens]
MAEAPKRLLSVAALRPPSELEQLELDLLLEAIHRRYGLDFRGYAPASLRRRIWNQIRAEGLATVTALQERVLHDVTCMERLRLALSVRVTAMFRDPSFYRALREQVVPRLRERPQLRIWHAGCSTGEEAYSMAILLEEEGLYERARLHATDVNETLVRTARAGIFPIEVMQEYTANYLHSGACGDFSHYYTARYDRAIVKQSLRRNIVFGRHDLASDPSPGRYDLIVCRNVLIYFGAELLARVHRLLHASLGDGGLLALGRKESLIGTPHEHDYEPLDARERLFLRRAA